MYTRIESHRLRNCLWLVRILQQHKRITLKEIQRLWIADGLNDNRRLPRTTFVDLRALTEDLLGLDIGCDRRTNEYYIVNSNNSKMSEWLVSSYNISSLLQEQQTLRDRILVEAPPSGMEHFDTIIDAFREGYALEMTYRKFSEYKSYTCFIEPYCMKHDHQRWYLVARKDHKSFLQTFALDRIITLTPRPDQKFIPEESFSPYKHFEHSFGVFVGQQEPVHIKIRAYGIGCNYLRTAPLHPSQQELLYNDRVSDFTIFCRPTRDLMLHLLSQGADVEIIEPLSLRKEMEEEIRKLAERYADRSE